MRQQTYPESLLLNLWRGLPHQILAFLHGKSYFYKGYFWKLLRKQGMTTCLVKVPAGAGRNINKSFSYNEMQNLPIWETQHFQRSYQELALATEEELASALRKQRVTNIRIISIRKDEEQIQTNTYILTFNQLYTPKEVETSYRLELNNMSQLPWGASNAKNMDTIEKPVEDDRHVKCSAKGPEPLGGRLHEEN